MPNSTRVAACLPSNDDTMLDVCCLFTESQLRALSTWHLPVLRPDLIARLDDDMVKERRRELEEQQECNQVRCDCKCCELGDCWQDKSQASRARLDARNSSKLGSTIVRGGDDFHTGSDWITSRGHSCIYVQIIRRESCDLNAASLC